MKTIFVLIVLLFFCSVILGQEQIDSLVHKTKTIDPAYQHLIYDYRIPDWGYHRFYLDFSTNLSGNDYICGPDSYYSEYDNSQYQGIIRPYFYLYQTSERYIFSLSSVLSSSYRYNQSREETETDIEKNIDRNFDNMFILNGNLNQYFGRLFYLKYYTTNRFRYYENRDHYRDIDKQFNSTSISKNINIRRDYNVNIRFGAGLGRIRNVNPVFKALRFSERLKDIGKTTDLSESEIKSLINLYSNESAYNSTFDRSRKYFYEALPAKVTKQIKNLQPWEMIYLDEVSNEILGDRYEGFEINGGIQLTHEHAINTNFSGSSELTLLGFYADQEYYHNISPGYQIGTNVYASYSKPLNDNTSIQYLGRGSAEISNLWNVIDKMLVEFDIGYEIGFASIDAIRYLPGPNETYEKWHRLDRYRLSLSLDYFLENYLSIGTSISNYVYHNWPTDFSFSYEGRTYYNYQYDKEKNWSVQVDLRYYIIRGMY